ncbi:hypothetical protein ATO8_07921 [Roseivivax marinus]|uniref:Sulfotransferase family protein n=1 Tax=Roseivivax marinus TaxID=1379903 RepID=W4HK59_9RHOB|nr:hypothetical protein [Roseivivax marinus]ETW13122.1 hypothetical protein ATO8_07921 [Roseivivax marinus]
MDVTLHLGAHRTASTSFQRYAAAHSKPLAAQRIAVWGPKRTRTGLLHNVVSRDARPRDRGRVRLACAAEAASATRTLVISDENMIGTPRANLRACALYPAAGLRLARLGEALGPVRRVVIAIRAQDRYWTSLAAYLVDRGAPAPDTVALAAMAAARRTWREVVTEAAMALPETEIVVIPFERFADRPDATLAALTGWSAPPRAAAGEFWVNRSPDMAALEDALEALGVAPQLRRSRAGRWEPLPGDMAARLREAYADDLYWLRAGADGLARYVEDPDPVIAAQTAPVGHRRGQDDEQRRLEGAG